MIHIAEKHKTIIKNILNSYPYQFYVYGSRSKGTQHPFSDLDICVMDPITDLEVAEIKEKFDESDLPFTIDIQKWSLLSDEFKELIINDLQPI